MSEQVDHVEILRSVIPALWTKIPCQRGRPSPRGLYHAPLLFSRAHKTHGLLIAALTVVALLSSASVAAPAGRIVLNGADAGSHLRLSTGGGDILVTGAMTDEPPRGCRFTH